MRISCFLVAAALGVAGNSAVLAETLWINGRTSIFSVDSATPGTVLSGPTTLTGLVGSDAIHAIDFHPTTGVLYGYASASGRLYTIDTTTGAASAVGVSTSVANLFVGMTFNTTGSELRVVHYGGTNFRIDPATGTTLATDTSTNEDGLIGVALDPASSTTFALEEGTGFLHRIGSVGGSPNSASTGLTELVGPSAIFSTRGYNFDISAVTGIAYADDMGGGGGGSSNLFTVNLLTGAGTHAGALASPLSLASYGIAVQPVVPEPTSIAIVFTAASMLGRKRQRLAAG
jgi:hypothetical protein